MTTTTTYIGYNVCNEKGQVVYANLPLDVADEVLRKHEARRDFGELYKYPVLSRTPDPPSPQ